jgi:protocatechuate 3,4-dioxygenase alpha subunit
MTRFKESPSQTAGPYVHIGCVPNFCGIEGVYPEDLGARMVNPDTIGDKITVRGVVYDGTGTPLRDAMVEIWQADAGGLYNSPEETRGTADPNFDGWGRAAGDYTTGRWSFDTIRPGRVPFVNGELQAPHISFWIVARGINLGLHTRMYFPEDATMIAADPLIKRIEHQIRVPTLVAVRTGEVEGRTEYQFDIRLQGENETIFFEA